MSRNLLTMSDEERGMAAKEYYSLTDDEKMDNKRETELDMFEYIAEGHALRYGAELSAIAEEA